MSATHDWPRQISRLKNYYRWITLASTISYAVVSLFWARRLFTQNSFAGLMARIEGRASTLMPLIDYGQAWKVTILTTLILGLITLPRWQGFLALATILFWEVINRILSM